MLRFEASEFPIESLSENILRVDKVPAGHHLILVHPIGSTEPGWVMLVLQTMRLLASRQQSGPTRSYRFFVSDADRQHWDNRYAERGMAPVSENGALPPPVFAHVEHLFPTDGQALELACGRGRGAVWLASREMDYWGVDVSPVGIDLARGLTCLSGVADRCRFDVVDLDDGLLEGPPVDLLFCHLFRDQRLDQAVIERLAPGGLLAVAVLSEVGVGPGEFRARPGELRESFGKLEILDQGEGDGMARILARRHR